MSSPFILIVGAGSAGRRHARNLSSLGARIACFDPRPDRRMQVSDELPVVAAYETLDAAFAGADRFAAAVIASPPAFHVEQALACLRQGVAVMLEKPVAPDLASARRLQAEVRRIGVPLLLGYTYRWWPPFIELRRRLNEKALGSLRHARIVMSAHLADWHPWERYQDFFMASRELGGGALLDESHFIDLMLWLFGRPRAISGRVERLSSLEISTDDNVDMVAVYDNGFRVSIHLDLYGRPHEKSVTVVGEGGTLQCLFDPHILRYSSQSTGPWEAMAFSCDRNDMFLGTAREFLELLQRPAEPTCTIDDGVEVLRCIETVRRSSAEERTIALSDVS